MKKKLITLLVIFLSVHSIINAGNNETDNVLKGCTPKLYLVYQTDTISYITCQSVNFQGLVSGDSVMLICTRNMADATLYFGTDTLYNGWIGTGWFYYISDSGNYILDLEWGNGITCPNSGCTEFIYLQDAGSTSVTETQKSDPIIFYPSISTGIFKLKYSGNILKHIWISNSTGQLIYSSSTNFSEIDLTGFSPGIYFYAITDEKENVFRGRIVKE